MVVRALSAASSASVVSAGPAFATGATAESVEARPSHGTGAAGTAATIRAAFPVRAIRQADAAIDVAPSVVEAFPAIERAARRTALAHFARPGTIDTPAGGGAEPVVRALAAPVSVPVEPADAEAASVGLADARAARGRVRSACSIPEAGPSRSAFAAVRRSRARSIEGTAPQERDEDG